MHSGSAKLISICAAVLAALALAAGCGGKTRANMSFPTGAGTPVVTYWSYKAISPVYNPDVPVTVVYGDGTLIKKEDAYKLTRGTLTRQQMSGLLKTLQDKGFFDMKSEYNTEKPLPGGTTDTVSVTTTTETHQVSVEGGAGPAGWNGIISAVTGLQGAGTTEYVPESITLFAREAAQVPQGAAVNPWPGSPSDLAGAAAQDAGLGLNGAAAGTAWSAVQSSFSQNSSGEDAYWSAGGKTYTFVYASPLLPGIKQPK
jgi:hypothetical protein